MRDDTNSTTKQPAGQAARRGGTTRMRSRRVIVAVVAAIAVAAAGLGPAVGVQVLPDDDAARTAFVFDSSTWGATWS